MIHLAAKLGILVIVSQGSLGFSQSQRQNQVDEAAQAFEQQRTKNLNQQQSMSLTPLPLGGFTFKSRDLEFETIPEQVLTPTEHSHLKIAAVERLKSGFVVYQKSSVGTSLGENKSTQKFDVTFYPVAREKKSGLIFYLNGKLRIFSASASAIQAFATREGLEIKMFQEKLQLGLLSAQPGTDLKILLQKAQSEFGRGKAELDVSGPPAEIR